MDLPLVSYTFENGADDIHQVAKRDAKCAYISASHQWDELHDILVMLWPGMGLTQLMQVIQEDYGFRATKDQYKKKFDQWYKKGILPSKKRSRGHKSQGEIARKADTVRELETTVIKHGQRLPAQSSSTGREGSISPTCPSLYQTPTGSDTYLYTTSAPSSSHQVVGIYRHRSSNLGTAKQSEFHALHANLWDKFFDAHVGDADQVEVGEAVRCMVEFLLELTKFDKNMETVTTHPGDLRLLRRVATLIRDRFSGDEGICGALDAAVPSSVVGPGVGAVPHFPRWPACLYCCQCGDGPYTYGISPGCASPECTSHIFCEFCLAEYK